MVMLPDLQPFRRTVVAEDSLAEDQAAQSPRSPARHEEGLKAVGQVEGLRILLEEELGAPTDFVR